MPAAHLRVAGLRRPASMKRQDSEAGGFCAFLFGPEASSAPVPDLYDLNRRGPIPCCPTMLRARGSHDVHSFWSTDAHQQDQYPNATDPVDPDPLLLDGGVSVSRAGDTVNTYLRLITRKAEGHCQAVPVHDESVSLCARKRANNRLDMRE